MAITNTTNLNLNIPDPTEKLNPSSRTAYNDNFQAIDTLLGNHRVTDLGVSADGWNYRKWSDGAAECWKDIEVENFDITAKGSLYGNAIASYNFPTGFFLVNTRPVCFAQITLGDYGIIANSGSANCTNEHTQGFMLLRHDDASGAQLNFRLAIHAIGKWK